MTPTPEGPPLPAVIGHRGAAAHAPENTLAGLDAAARLGARWVEVDVRLSCDGVPFLLHDATVDRTTSGRGPASALTADALGRLDAGSPFDARFAGEPVPTLADALARVAAAGQGIVLELKPDAGREHDLLAALADVLDGARPTPRLLSSSDPAVLAAAAAALPHEPRAVVLDQPPADGYGPLLDLGVSSLHCWERWLHGPALEQVLAAGEVASYTVNAVDRARALWAAGVTALFSDRPGELLAARAG